MEKKGYVVAIDLGTSHVVVAVGTPCEEGRLHLEAVAVKPSEGVAAGAIENIELVGNAIREAVSEVEATLSIHITEAYAGISGDFIRCARHHDFVFVSDSSNGIRQSDVDALYARMLNVKAPSDETILERIPQNYVVDGNREVANPVGSFGERLSSTFNFILGAKVPIERLQKALTRLGIRPLGIFPNALVTAEAILFPDEKEEGVAMVDIGGGVTDVAIYCNKVIRYVATIPFGGHAINRDIRSQSIPEKRVEQLKVEFGCALPESVPVGKLVQVRGRTPRESREILLHNLSLIIEARVKDLIEYVMNEIRDSGYEKKLGYGIVLTGGGARLREIATLFHKETGMEVRVAPPDPMVDEASHDALLDPALATVVGLMLRGLETGTFTRLESRPAPGATPLQPGARIPSTPAPPAVPPVPESAVPPAGVRPEEQPVPDDESDAHPRRGFFARFTKVIERLERTDDDDEI